MVRAALSWVLSCRDCCYSAPHPSLTSGFISCFQLPFRQTERPRELRCPRMSEWVLFVGRFFIFVVGWKEQREIRIEHRSRDHLLTGVFLTKWGVLSSRSYVATPTKMILLFFTLVPWRFLHVKLARVIAWAEQDLDVVSFSQLCYAGLHYGYRISIL